MSESLSKKALVDGPSDCGTETSADDVTQQSLNLCHLANLPDELLTLILEMLPKSDLKQARLACSRWAGIGVRRLIERIYFAPRYEAMELFDKISSHPVFSKSVQEMTYDSRLFLPQILDGEIYREALNQSFGRDLKPQLELEAIPGVWVSYDSLTYRRSLREYSQFVVEQDGILSSSKDLECLCAGLGRMKNLRKVHVRNQFRRFPSEAMYTEEHDRAYEERCGQSFGHSMLPSTIDAARQLLDMLDQQHRSFRQDGIEHLLQALSRSGCQILELVMKDIPAFDGLWDTNEMKQALPSLFSRLEDFELDITLLSDTFYETFDKHLCYHLLNDYIAFCSSVRSLTIRCLPDVENLRSPNLTELDLAYISVKDETVDFLKAHRSTLRKLYLDTAWMVEDFPLTWMELCHELAKYLQLKEVGLKDIEGADDYVSQEDIRASLDVIVERGQAEILEIEERVPWTVGYQKQAPRSTNLASILDLKSHHHPDEAQSPDCLAYSFSRCPGDE